LSEMLPQQIMKFSDCSPKLRFSMVSSSSSISQSRDVIDVSVTT
jgi:hypothetical protein